MSSHKKQVLSLTSGFLFLLAAGLAASLLALPRKAEAVMTPLPIDLVIPVRVPGVEIVDMDLALPGISGATVNTIRVSFERSVLLATNGVSVSATVRSTMDILVYPDEIVAAQTNYTSVLKMPLEVSVPIVYNIAMTKLVSVLPMAAAELMKP